MSGLYKILKKLGLRGNDKARFANKLMLTFNDRATRRKKKMKKLYKRIMEERPSKQSKHIKRMLLIMIKIFGEDGTETIAKSTLDDLWRQGRLFLQYCGIAATSWSCGQFSQITSSLGVWWLINVSRPTSSANNCSVAYLCGDVTVTGGSCDSPTALWPAPRHWSTCAACVPHHHWPSVAYVVSCTTILSVLCHLPPDTVTVHCPEPHKGSSMCCTIIKAKYWPMSHALSCATHTVLCLLSHGSRPLASGLCHSVAVLCTVPCHCLSCAVLCQSSCLYGSHLPLSHGLGSGLGLFQLGSVTAQ